jgi:hypothetical protein
VPSACATATIWFTSSLRRSASTRSCFPKPRSGCARASRGQALACPLFLAPHNQRAQPQAPLTAADLLPEPGHEGSQGHSVARYCLVGDADNLARLANSGLADLGVVTHECLLRRVDPRGVSG